MKKIVFLAAAFVLTCASTGNAQTTATLSAACSSSAKTAIQAAVNKAAAAVPTTINVTGSCVDNVKVPKGKVVWIVGGSGATLAPADATQATVDINGEASITTLNISAASSTDNGVINVWGGGQFFLIGSSVSVSANTKLIIGIGQASFAQIINSRIRGYTSGSQATAIGVWQGSQLVVRGDPQKPAGIDGYGTTIQMDTTNTSGSSPKSASIDGINCGNNSGVKVDVSTALVGGVSTSGYVKIAYNGTGIRANQCSVNLYNNTSSVSNISISDNSANGLFAYDGNYQINGVTIQNNGSTVNKWGWGVNMISSPAVITSSIFSGNYKDILSDRGSMINLDKWDSPTWKTSFVNLTNSSLGCGVNGYITYDATGILQSPFPLGGSDPCIVPQ